jgi:hypothetical protein
MEDEFAHGRGKALCDEVARMTIYYEIRVAGIVPPGALYGFEQLAAEQPAETVVRGPLPDRAAVHGLLARLESAGVQLIRLRRQPPYFEHVGTELLEPGQEGG